MAYHIPENSLQDDIYEIEVQYHPSGEMRLSHQIQDNDEHYHSNGICSYDIVEFLLPAGSSLGIIEIALVIEEEIPYDKEGQCLHIHIVRQMENALILPGCQELYKIGYIVRSRYYQCIQKYMGSVEQPLIVFDQNKPPMGLQFFRKDP